MHTGPTDPTDPAFWAAVRRLFDQLADLPPAQREAALRDSGESAALQDEVRSLLAHADDTEGNADGFLEQPAAAAVALPPLPAATSSAPPADQPSRIGQRIGPWLIDGLLGRGGMGEVWAARRAD
ncbi:MAG: hypothetical protein CFE45_38290, partial [Burkholderiales bacterium PBB5]